MFTFSLLVAALVQMFSFLWIHQPLSEREGAPVPACMQEQCLAWGTAGCNCATAGGGDQSARASVTPIHDNADITL